MDEFDLIERYLRPLSGEGSFALTDDIAVIDGLSMTTDVIVSGVHFRPEDPLDLVARKAMRVNLSDLVATAIRPTGYLLGVTWPLEITEAQIEAFAKGLKEDQAVYGLSLLGGDTTRHRAAGLPLTISITMVGTPMAGGPVLRSGARPGDRLMVTGSIGDGALGLQHLDAGGAISDAASAPYLLPTPPFELIAAIGLHATAGLDLSDGLVADARHLARASGVSLVMEASRIPLSEEGAAYVSARTPAALVDLVTAGDDYQALLSVPPTDVDGLSKAASHRGVRLTDIGVVAEGEGVSILGADGHTLPTVRRGFTHF